MTDLHHPNELIDSHQHFWKPSERRYEWLERLGPPLNADFGPEDVAPAVERAGISGTVLVQATDSYEDTFYMLSVAARNPIVRGVVAWVPLDRAEEAEAALDLYALSTAVVGIRVLNHNYEDPRWLLRPEVDAVLRLLAKRGLVLDVLSVRPEHLVMLGELAHRHPELSIVLDHLGNPDIGGQRWEPWASLIAEVASYQNVRVKLSGLSTNSSTSWTFSDWSPYVEHAVRLFGSERMMVGSDWPVSTLAGDFESVWTAQRQSIAHLTPTQQDDILFRSAIRTYGLEAS